jgi:hypothetical protein
LLVLPDGAIVAMVVRKEMRTSRSLTVISVIVLFVMVGLSQRADAYLDPGTGSYVLQLSVAGLFGAIFSAKSLWLKLRAIFPGTDRSGK